jgi:hypothetical protein
MTDFGAGPVLTARPRCTLFPWNKGSFPRFNDLLGFSWHNATHGPFPFWATLSNGSHGLGNRHSPQRRLQVDSIKSRGYPQIIQVMDDHAKIILDHFSIETHGDLGIHLKKTPISKREHFRFRERSCSASDAERVQPEVVLGSSRNMFVASGLSVNYPQTMEGNKGNRQDYITTNPRFPEQLG